MHKLPTLPRSRQLFRFNLLFLAPFWGLMLLVMIAYSQSASSLLVTASQYVLVGVGLLGTLMWTFALFNSTRRIGAIKKSARDAAPTHNTSLHTKAVEHLIVLCVYKEPLDLLERTLESVLNQSVAHRIRIVVGFEERTPDLEGKRDRILAFLQGRTLGSLVTIHPYGVEGELAGKCSNVNYAVRTAVDHWKLDTPARMKNVVLTTCDADNLFHPMHFAALSQAFFACPKRYEVVWQAPLFYDWNLEKSSFFTRNTGHLRTVLITGLLTPLSINTMSIQSLSLSLCKQGDYFHPAYQMEDVLNVVRWMTEIRGSIEICSLDVPVMSGPTSGHTTWHEFKEWFLQARRWTVGSAEVFHYFMARSKSLPAFPALRWGSLFFAYYALLIPVVPVLGLVHGIMNVLLETGGSLYGTWRTWLLAFSVHQIASALYLHFLRIKWSAALPIRERISTWRRLVDIITLPLTQTVYAFVALFAIHEMAIRGRKVCVHNASDKNALNREDGKVVRLDAPFWGNWSAMGSMENRKS